MANDRPEKPKIDRPRRRPYEEPVKAEKKTGTTSSPAKKKPSAGKKQTTTRKKAPAKKVSKASPAASAARRTSTPPVMETIEPKLASQEIDLLARHEIVPVEREEEVIDLVEVLPVEPPLGPKAEKMLRKYVAVAMGTGLIPIPFVDVASLIPIQMTLVSDLADLYNLPSKQDRTRSMVAGVFNSLLAWQFATCQFRYLSSAIPIIGPMVSFLTFPILAGASTYAVGRVFIQHFETGGTLLDFDPEKVKEHYKSEFEAGKNVATAMKGVK